MIQAGLAYYEAPYMRLQKLSGINGHLLINDAYNANPSSMIAGLQVLQHISKRRYSVAVLGDIYELGNFSVEGHSRVGKFVAKSKPQFLITIGSQAAYIAKSAANHGYPTSRIRAFSTQAAALNFIRSAIPAGSILYFKASRKVALEKLVKQLQKRK